jgi:hypothetical protein
MRVRDGRKCERCREDRDESSGGNAFHGAAIVAKKTASRCALLGKRCASIAL